MTQNMNHTFVKALRAVLVVMLMLLTFSNAMADGVVVKGNVYGGGNLAEVKGSVTVNIKAGTVVNDVYGGGALANTNTNNWNGSTLTVTYHEVKLPEGTSLVGYYSKSGESYAAYTEGTAEENTTYYKKTETIVNLTGGTIGNAYGGGLGQKNGVNGATSDIQALVYGDVLVNVNGTKFTQEFDTYQEGTGENATTVNVPKTGRVFGCNNLNGSPKKTVTVHVYQTKPLGDGGHQTGQYEIAAVYGGGNEAAYEPTISGTETDASHAHTNVIIDGCSLTSIKQVYGGGNAASTPSTQVTINGAFEIDEVFGGGNGNDKIKRTSGTTTTWEPNPGANVGFHYYAADATNAQSATDRAYNYGYGFGKAQVNINGGNIHAVYGGSNAKGNVRLVAVAMLDQTSEEDCFTVDEAYGGGKAAEMDGRAELNLGCIPGVGKVYGGARAASVNNDVVLTITNGTYTDVFGGNNEEGTINGTITINIEETGCRPIHITNLYGGGNLAPYSAPANENGPTLNIKSFTSIDHVYGGGYGAGADVTGNVTVNINEVKGRWSQANSTVETNSYSETGAENLGVIGDVYGGGYGADVIGNVEVNIGTEEKIEFVTTPTNLTADSNGKYTVEGANITGSVYGGGYGDKTTVTGNVAVNVGGEKTEGTTTTFIGGNIAIGGSVYGGSALGAVNASTTKNTSGEITKYTPTANATTAITLKKGNVANYVFGGGMGNANTIAHVFGLSTVALYGDVVAGGLYGGCDANGEMHDGTQLDLFGGTVGKNTAPNADILFGGGLGQNTKVDGNVTVNVGSKDYTGDTSVTIWGNVYGGGALGDVNTPKTSSDATVYTTLVNLFKGTVNGNVFGGGLGQAAKAAVDAEYTAVGSGTTLTSGNTYYKSAEGADEFVAQGDEVANGTNYFEMTTAPTDAVPLVEPAVKGKVRVDLNGYDGIITDPDNENYNANAFGSCIVTGSIFGCNNTKGSPENDVEVHIYKTIGIGSNIRSTAKNNTTFDLTSVFGGGNKATYSVSGKTAKVIIETCDVSIEDVYGGGYGADVPNTQVEVKGAYEIGTVYGGGYGEGSDDPTATNYNPGANVNGSTDVLLKGGVVHEVYGGSNTKGNIVVGSNVNVSDGSGCCDLKVDNIYGGGKNASMEGGTSIVLGCQPDTWIEDIYAGSREADVDGNVKLTITSGKFERVFGGNKTSGKLKGSITVNIEETGNCGTPIIIGELYAGGNEADYSIYGYKADGTPMTADELRTKLTTDNPEMTAAQIDELFQTTKKAEPQLNVRAFTSIGAVYGGGYSAKMYADPTISINVVKGSRNTYEIGDYQYTPSVAPFHHLPYPAHASGAIGTIGNVFGGGNLATVYGSTTVNIGTEEKVEFVTPPAHLGSGQYTYNETTKLYEGVAVEGANITGNVYGGGNLADVTGNTQINVCAIKNGTTYSSVTPGTAGVTIGGNVFGGGKGDENDVFECRKAMVGIEDDGEANPVGGTTVVIGNGTVNGNVYGGGEIGRVEKNTVVTIGLEPSTSTPVINGYVFGAGSGILTHGYSALVRGNSTVTIQGDAKVKNSVYGGGEISSVGRYTLVDESNQSQYPGLELGMPGSLANENSGNCTVSVRDNAVVGPDAAMEMKATGGPVFNGNVFGGGKGVLPGVYAYNKTDKTTMPKRMMKHNGTLYKEADKGITWEYIENYDESYQGTKYVWEYFDTEAKYLTFIETLALATETEVTIGAQDETPFIKGSVYGGSENGIVQHDTKVKIAGGQIGCATGMTAPYGENDFINPATSEVTTSLATCATWDYVDNGYTYDKFADADGNYSYTGDYSVIPADEQLTSSEGGRLTATDGHTFYGNVFGGGSGYFPYAPGKWHRAGGMVGGDTQVDIEGGHILSNVYGGNEQTDVGTYTKDSHGGLTVPLFGTGKCTVNMSGGTIGVPRTKDVIAANPVIGNLFGAGKGDKRVLFNTWTNVRETEVNVTGGIVYGSVFGGGEDGHVMQDAVTKIEQASGKTITIGSTGESTADGNVFGGGRGSESALTAGVVGGNVSLTINSGKILGSVYGGGRLASVGTSFVNPTIPDSDHEGQVIANPDYGKLQSPAADHGHITININGGDIGTTTSTGISGNVFGGSKGTTTNFDLGIARSTTINMTGGTAFASVYGGGELAQVVGSHTTDGKSLGTEINISGGTIGISGKGAAIWGNVFGGGKGNITHLEAGLVKTNTKVSISETDATSKPTKIWHNIYGGGAYGSVGTYTYNTDTDGKLTGISGYTSDGKATIVVSGGTIGEDGHENGMIFGSSRGDVGASGEIHDKLAWVYDTEVTVNDGQINGSVYGGGENGHNYHDAVVNVHGGIIGMTTTPAADNTDNNDLDGADYPYRGNVYGGGCGTDKYYADRTKEKNDGNGDTYNPLAGIVQGDVTVLVDGGHVVHNVYGAGAMGSVGTVTNFDDLDDTTKGYKHASTKSDGAFYDFGLSWPYEFTYGNTGLTKVTIEGNAIIGVSGSKGGHVFGAARGAVDVGEDDIAEQRYVEAKLANVRETQVIIGTDGGSSTTTTPTIHGSVYGGGEDGHVNQDASVTIHHGRIDHSVFGGGKGESTFETTLWDPTNEGHDKATKEDVHSWTAGKVYGSTTITMNGGSVGYNIYGGGNLASVGIGNYAGGSDDYSTVGYGELPPESAQALWTNTNFMGSDLTNPTGGLATVTINAGKVGVKTDGSHTGVDANGDPYGNVFGSSRGKAALNVGQLSPRYRYVPDFFLGYVNQTAVTIGDGTNTPVIFGSVYGGGQDGHVRRSTNVTINKSTIGHTDVSHSETLKKEIGNVFGAGSGLGQYTKGTDKFYNNSSGSVTCSTTVEVNNGANILGNVYGGGALSSVGPPFTGQAIGIETKSNAATDTKKSVSFTQVDIKGGTISGNVYGASRGGLDLNYNGEDPNTYATDLWSTVNVIDGAIAGSVFGGGEAGQVKGGVEVNITGGTVANDVYGGGALAHTNTSNWVYNRQTGTTPGSWGTTWADGMVDANGKTTYKTNVNLKGGTIGGDAYGGGLGDANIAALVYGDVLVKLNETTASDNCVVKGNIFGCNNVNGTPKGDVTVHVYKTQGWIDDCGTEDTTDDVSHDQTSAKSTNAERTGTVYELAAVYGGGNQAAYVPASPYTTTNTTGSKSQVIIEGCQYTSIETVYGGGNAAAVPETNVEIRSAYEINSVFGGGNGYSATKNHTDPSAPNYNPGADVGTLDKGTSTYGTGNANTLLIGGFIHEAYGGSNQEGQIKGKVNINTDPKDESDPDYCALDVKKLVAAGKDADVDGDLIVILGCKPTTKTPLVFAGADNANVNGNVELTITSGTFGQVFGGNNLGGVIKGHIKLNIEETGCNPIRIDELYLGGNQAAYSIYGYYVDTSDNNKVKPRTAAMHAIAEGETGYVAPLTNPSNTDNKHPFPYAEPILNIVSATSIGKVFGGGLGEGAVMHANPTVNINMIKGTATGSLTTLGTIGDVFGGGNAANVIGNTTINIGTETTVQLHESLQSDGVTYNMSAEQDVLGANITGNVYGGGQLADVGQYDVDNDHVDVAGNTYVNIGAKYNTTTEKWESVAEGTSKVFIAGNVFGGGEGEAAESGDGAFKCAKAIVTGGTNIHIGNGTINGTVYGGGEVGRVEGNSVVAIGIGEGVTSGTPTSTPEIKGDVFGAGKGKKTHGYSALLRGNPTVTIEGDAKVRGSVYGGGEIASVGKYNVKKGDNNPVGAPADVLVGMPYSLANSGSGYCTIIIQGNAEIGPEAEMKMTGTTSGKPDDTGHVIGGGKGVLPYDGYGVTGDPWKTDPWRVSINDQKDIFNKSNATYTTNYEKEYFKYIETLALATETNVTIAGNAFVKGSVYGGSLNGHVQHDTHVTIADDCQIGQGEGANGRYTSTDWASESLAECPHWDFDATSGAPYDPLATPSGTYDYENYGFVPTAARKTSSKGGLPVAKDGHTYYGNVFGGGSGVIPYAPGLWHRGAGSVGGDTYVNITGGHILTSVYGGNEHTDVGTYEKDASGQPTTTPAADNARGKCTVNMTSGTVGVPRTDAEKLLHPVVGNVFGAGKGDQRIFFNTWTNVINTEVNISGDARIYGSVFGGGEDGHVISDAETNIGNVTIKTGKDSNGDEIISSASANGLIIGTTGTSYYDGHVFGGGRGFSGDAQTAGTVGGNVRLNINAGSVYGSVYGGGRLASVGTQFTAPDDDNYGNFVEDETGTNAKTYGHVTVNISGGTIGNDTESTLIASEGHWYDHTKGGNVFGGSMGRLTLLNGSTNEIWPKMAQVKETNVNISGDAIIKSNVYGGGELGTVRDNAHITINGGTVRRDVYGGGYGSKDYDICTIFNVKEPNSTNTGYDTNTYAFTPMQFAGCVGKSTTVNMSDGYVRKSIYGGGEMASVGIINCQIDSVTTEPSKDKVVVAQKNGKYYFYKNMVKHWDEDNEFALSWLFKFNYMPTFDGATHINITGGRIGTTGRNTPDDYGTDNGDVYGGGKGYAGDYNDYAFCANVGSTEVNIEYSSTADPATYENDKDIECITGAVYGGGENGHVMGDTYVTLKKGLIGHALYGGGSGKDHYEKSLLKIGADYNSTNPADYYSREIYSITAGKVFGNTNVTMIDGRVLRNVYGGGTMGSVGKGNYAGGTDDYSTGGYGENAGGKLWDKSTDNSKAFMNSGICTVKIHGGTIGYTGQKDGLPYGNVFGGCRGDAAPNITESPRYLYYPEFYVGYANETIVEIGAPNSTTGPTIMGSVYGGGQDGHVRRDATVTINSGTIGKTFTGTAADLNSVEWLHSGNVYGAGSGIGEYKYTYHYTDRNVEEENYSTSAGSVTRFTKVEVKGGTIHRNVYGGGSLASVGAPKIDQTYDEYRKDDTATGSVPGNQTLNEVIISGGTIGDANSYDADGNYVYGGRVFGGSRGDANLDATKFSTSMFTSITVNPNTVAANSPVIKGSVFGGGEVGIVKGSVDVTMNGGTVNYDVYGGGALANTQTSNWNATGGTDGHGDWTDATNKSALYKTTVNLKGGTISRNAYGGALGRVASTGVEAIEAYVYGDVTVKLNEGKTETDKGCIVNKVFGCNNLNGTPKGKAQVYVYATQNKNASTIGEKSRHTGMEAENAETTYDVAAVYGGGNLSPYDPVDAYSTNNATKDAAQSEVYIYGCDLTSIKQVYGGGNAAPAPATYVRVDGAYEIEELFGGGNGKDDYVIDGKYYDNPGANVGYKNYTHLDGTGDGSKTNPYNCVDNDDAKKKDGRQNTTLSDGSKKYMYGSGVAHVEVFGGTIHASYGGSNEKGNISTKAWSKYEEGGDCDLNVDETYGGGKNSLIDGEIVLDLGCTTYMPTIFGGSKDADVNSDIVLNISNGRYDQVFGGNNHGGNVNGSITVNIKEDGCVPIEIGELYLGGYLAGYSVYGYNANGTVKTSGERLYADPRLNVISATSIGNIFGGGYQAIVVGNPYVNINMEQGKVEIKKKEKTEGDDASYAFEENGKTYVYKDGGGTIYDPAKVTPNADETSYYATLEIGTIGNVYGGGNEADIIGDTYVEIGTGTQHDANGELVAITPARNAATITGNVFGGGKGVADEFTCAKAMVGVVDTGKGSTNVTIGNGTVNGNVYGGGEIGRVEANTNVTIGLAGNETNEIIVKGNVFGAGAGLSTHGYSALVRGNSNVTVQGKAQIGKSVYGGGEIATVGRYNVVNGMPTTNVSGGDCTVTIKDNAQIADDVFGAGKGVDPTYDANNKPKKMNASSGWDTLESETAYLSFLETLALASNTDVTIDGNAKVKGNVYGGSESGFVQDNTSVTIQGNSEIGTADADGKDVDGNVFGGGKGIATFFAAGRVLGNTNLQINNGIMHGTVYGGGELGYVGKLTVSSDYRNFTWKASDGNDNSTNNAKNTGVCNVTISNGTINGHVFGAGKGIDDSFWCEKGIVYGTNVNISNGTINGNVYGGGEVGRIETDAVVTIGASGGTGDSYAPVIKGDVYGAGAGVKTHGYSALVRGNTYVTVQGKAKVEKSVYGGGMIAAVGKYMLDSNNMPYSLVEDGLGICNVTVSGNAEIAENVFGAGEGLVPQFDKDNADKTKRSRRMTLYTNSTDFPEGANTWEWTDANQRFVWQYFQDEAAYLRFLETLALATQTTAKIEGNAKVYGNVYGGSESGFVQHNTAVTIAGGTIGSTTAGGNVFGGGLGLATFAEAGRVSGNTMLKINGGTMYGNVYGGGSLGDVGKITKNTTDYNYTWTDQEGNANGTNVAKNTGVCTVEITDGTIAGHVFGAGKGLSDTFWCEKAMAYSTNVSITDGTVKGNVYGGGQLGRVENNAVVTIGDGTNAPDINGNVFGAGAGVATHGYSALVRGDATVTVQGKAKVGKSVYGGGETASVGRFKVVDSLPKEPLSGGTCTVTIQGSAEIGADGEGHVFGACKGVEPDYDHNAGHVINTGESKSFANEAEYLSFLKTLALTSNTNVTIGESASVNGSVFGGGQRGITLGNVKVDMTGGTVTKDVYGGGALADTNTGNATGYGTSTESIGSTSTYTTTVNLQGGTVNDVYGGGLGQKIGDVNGGTSDVEAIVYGDVLVELNKDVAEDAKGCIVDRVFGANNINGTPKGHVKVHVHATQNKNLNTISDKSTDDNVYDVSYVFGGGNAADYVPADTKQSTEVIIEGCDLTSIDEVYGGGYGAATPATSVLVKGTKIINNVYGGGYGAGATNPGANVGYMTGASPAAYTLGSGKAIVQLMAGMINNVYGGSNTKGDIRGGSSVTNVVNSGGPGCCDKLSVGEIYGGGKQADMYGGAEIVLGCMPNDWIGAIYAGAENADIGGDVGLTLTSGKFERVFGGNNKGGKINGYIEVNIEENPECETPIIIGGLYGGGNMAPYTVPAEYTANNPNYQSPRVNVRAFTSIGNIYGGGFGKDAIVTGNPLVNINQVEGGREYAGETKDLVDGSKVTLYARSKDDKIGVIGNVFGGGNAAKVIGNTTVNIGTESEQQMESLKTTDADGKVTVVKKPVLGADIRGNVYGGGNAAEVTGKTNVVIGEEKKN